MQARRARKTMTPQTFDVIIIGAGAAGLFCAGIAGQRGLRVLLIDHAPKVAEKIRISGGGRCNFTNRDAGPANFLSANPHFCKSALARYTAQDFIALVQRNRIGFHEKHRGQLFCDHSAEGIIELLLRECDAGHVTRWQPCGVQAVRRTALGFEADTSQGTVIAQSLVIASGGLSIPKIGATDFGYRIARQFDLDVVEPRPALVPLTFEAQQWQPFVDLSGLSLEVRIQCGAGKSRGEFLEDLLFTHRGLSGPAVLQISSFWREGNALSINLLPNMPRDGLLEIKATSRKTLLNSLSAVIPERLAAAWLAQHQFKADQRMAEMADRELLRLQERLCNWHITPNGSEGYRKAEVTAGGVSTSELSSTTMQAHKVPGLHFIGEVVDVTGWLGGYNFQWAWSSAYACALALTRQK
jgi:predicted Rossmann fold flavoprotein